MLLHLVGVEESRVSLETLSPEQRTSLSSHWRRRAKSERRIGWGFAKMVPRLEAQGVPKHIVRRFREASEEEARHCVLCLELAGTYQPGTGVECPLEIEDMATPRFEVGDERLDLALLVLGTCCINETLAAAYISACLEHATVPCAVQANRLHLREEIGHGRLGWALLASGWVDDNLRTQLEPTLPGMLAANVPLWLRVDPFLGRHGMPHLGHPSQLELQTRISTCVREVLIPGFRHVGLRYRGPTEGWGESAADATS